MKNPVEILLVDDNPSDAELTLHVLSQHGLADSIQVVHDGAEALEFIFCTGAFASRDPHKPPKMIVLDLKLPKVDGMEVLRRAKADPRTRAIPIVVFSSSWEDCDVRQARELGAHSYVVKPVDFKELVEAVRTALAIIVLEVLILEDRHADAELMVHELRRSGFDPHWARVETEPDFLAHLDPPPDVILADYTMPQLDARRALQLLQERGLNIPFIVVTGTIGEDMAVTMMRLGATDYLLKDRLGRLGPAVKHALMEIELRQDKSRAEWELKASEVRFHTFMRHSPALTFIKDESGRILYVNNASEDAEDLAAQLRADASVFESGEPSRTIEEVTTSRGQARQMLCFRFLFNDAAGRRLLGGVSVDITEQKSAEKALSEALAAKDVLLREVHHRVKNNLQTISSLLNMQAELLPDLAVRQALRDAQRRVHSMALIHEQMYGDKDMDEVDFGEYARRLARDLFDSFGAAAGHVRLRFAFEPVSLAMDQMIPCGLILNELITNSLKYAFPGDRAGEILVSLHCPDGKAVTLAVKDNGVGLPPGSAGRHSESLGSRIVEILTRQLGGSLDRQSAGGVSATVRFTRFDRLKPNSP
jgi:two-component sensor histidine kinase/CheY-like chemotaxis protein